MPFRALEDSQIVEERPARRGGFRPIDAMEADLLPAETPSKLRSSTPSASGEFISAGETVRALEGDRPAAMIRTRGGQPVLVRSEPFRDPFDKETQGEQSAPWGDVLQSLPGQMVASARGAFANLRRAGSEESAANRREALAIKAPTPADAAVAAIAEGVAPQPTGPIADTLRVAQAATADKERRAALLTAGETPGGAVTGRVDPRALARQERLLVKDEAATAAAERDAARAREDMALVTPRGMNVPQQAVSSLAQSAPTTLAGIAAGILTRSPALAMALAGGGGAATQVGSTYGEAREKGATHRAAGVAATIDGILEGVGEALPLKVALAPGAPIMRRIINTIAAEAGQETATQAAQDLNAYLSYNPDITLKEAWHNLKVAALAGGMGGAVYGSVGAAANAGRPSGAPVAPSGSTTAGELLTARLDQSLASGPAPGAASASSALPDEVPSGGRGFRPLTAEGPTGDAQFGETLGMPASRPGAGGFRASDDMPDVAALQTVLAEQHPRVEVGLIDHPAGASLEVQHIGLRDLQADSGQNLGGGAMTAVTNHADQVGRELMALVRPTTDSTMPLERLVEWYERHGFVKGEEQPFENAFYMYREPRTHESADRSQGSEQGPPQARRSAQGEEGAGEAGPEATAAAQAARVARAAPAAGRTGQRLGMPAGTSPVTGTAPAGATAAPPATPTPAQSPPQPVPKGDARPDAIRAAVQDLFDTVVSEKHQGHRNLGVYRVKPRTIRLRNRNDLRTLTHEIGHHLSELNQTFRAVMAQHAAELMNMAPAAYKKPGASKKLLIEEGFAEFMAEYLTDRPTARAQAPAFFKAFVSWLNQPENKPLFAAVQRVSGMLGAHEALSPEDKILAKVGVYQPAWRDRVGALLTRDTWDTFAQAVLDKWHPLKAMVDDLMPGVSASRNPYMAARLLAGDAAIIEDWIGNFTSPYDFAKRLDPKNYGKALKEILQPILAQGEEVTNRFKAYLIARRAAELKRAGKENLFDVDEIVGGLSLETPEFKAVAAEIYQYSDRLLDYAVEGGLLSPDAAQAFRQYASYIPFFREPDGDAQPGGRGSPFKRLTGGTQNLRDPIANLIQNTANIIHATNRNAVVQRAVELAKAVSGGGRWLETVPVPLQAQAIATQRIVEDLRAQGVTIDVTTAKNLAAMQTFFVPTGRSDPRTRALVYKEAGESKAVQVNDRLLWKVLGNLPPLELGLIGKMLAFPAQTLRAGVVLDPTFMARNFIRDTLSATIQSRGAFLPVASTAQGIKMMAQQDDAYKLWRAFGGAFSDQFREPEEAAALIARMAKRGGFSAHSILHPGRILDALKRVGAFAESGSRIGEFAATYRPGDVDSAMQAALNAREVSTDFGMRGGSEAIQVWTRIVPFMNPAMQGIYKSARVLSGNDGVAAAKKAALVGSAMALASVALALLNSDEDWYQRLEAWEKATYWHVKIGEEIYRLPKPFEYGALFASAPEAIALKQQGKEGWRDFKERMLQVLGQVLGFRVIPQAVTIVAEPVANKSFFTGRPIVTDRDKDLEPALQANPSTSKSARAVGEALNYSPAMIDNHVRNVFGTLGVHATTAADVLLEKTGMSPEGRERTWRSWPVIKAFVHDPDNPNSKQMSQFYEDLKDYRRALKSMREWERRGDDEAARSYEAGKTHEIATAKTAEKLAAALAKMRRSNERMNESRDLSPAEKRAQINETNRQMQDGVESFQAQYRRFLETERP